MAAFRRAWTGTARELAEDRARIEYVRRAYGVDGREPQLYHLIVDSTAIDLDTCGGLIVAAAEARVRAASADPARAGERAGS